jgi:hypothetical protein
MNNSDANNKQCKATLKLYFDCVNVTYDNPDKYSVSDCNELYKLFNQCIVNEDYVNVKYKKYEYVTAKYENKINEKAKQTKLTMHKSY